MPERTRPEPASRATNEGELGGRMSFLDHLVELRKRIISALIAVGIGMVVGLLVSQKFIGYVLRPIQAALSANGLHPDIYTRSLQGYVGLYINLGLYLGIVLAMPFVLYQVWLFVAPGLYRHERRAVSGFVISSMLLFLCGIAFGYFVLLPKVLTFLVAFVSHGPIKPWIDINEYFDLVLVVLVGLGVIFEMPVVVFVLTLFGIVTPKFLVKNFRYAMLLITVVAAVVTPTPDATTMLIFMMPMIALYVVSVGVSYAVVRRKKARELTATPPRPDSRGPGEEAQSNAAS